MGYDVYEMFGEFKNLLHKHEAKIRTLINKVAKNKESVKGADDFLKRLHSYYQEVHEIPASLHRIDKERDKNIAREELIKEMIDECKHQIEVREYNRDHVYNGDRDQVRAYNEQIEYYKFMIIRLEGFEGRKKAGITGRAVCSEE